MPAARTIQPSTSVLDRAQSRAPEWDAALPLYVDLNLDQIIAAVVKRRERYDLAPLFRTPLDDAADIAYRQDICRDLERAEIRSAVDAFARRMLQLHQDLELACKLRYRWQAWRWFLAGAAAYCDGVSALADALADVDLRAAGLCALAERLRDYRGNDEFGRLQDDVQRAEAALDGIQYCVEIKGLHVRVRRYRGEPDYSEQITGTFAKFREDDAKSYLVRFPDGPVIDHVQEQILDGVARLFPDEFALLERFRTDHEQFTDATVLRFEREVQFYLAYLDHVRPLRAAGLAFDYPELSDEPGGERARATFDLALAGKLVADEERIVTNDLELSADERLVVVSGPNQGGKTTMARAFGQLHYLAKLGLPVPGRDVRLQLCDAVLTQFERPENLHDLVGKLQDDLQRIHRIVERATPRTLVILNEIFNSTTLQDATYLSSEILRTLRDRGALVMCVTFIDQLATLDSGTVSLVATVAAEDETRTYRLVRRPADGRAYALTVAARHGLTYQQLTGRSAP